MLKFHKGGKVRIHMVKNYNYKRGEGTQCAMCDMWSVITYTVKQDVALCATCAGLIPNHIPIEQMVRFALRLIEGRKDGFQSKVVR